MVIPELPLRLLRLERGTVVHLHIAQAFTPEAVWAAHRLRALPYVAHLHLDAGPSGPAGGLLKVYKPVVLRRVLREAGVVVVFTEEQAESVVAAYGVEPARVRVVPNGVDGSFFDPPRRLPTGRRPRLLFVGRLSVQKNLPQLLDTLEGVSERFDTVLVGDGELEAELRARVGRLGLANVTFAGRADGEALLSRYADADVFVLPSEREGMPLALLEAMAMALPTVATDIPGTARCRRRPTRDPGASTRRRRPSLRPGRPLLGSGRLRTDERSGPGPGGVVYMGSGRRSVRAPLHGGGDGAGLIVAVWLARPGGLA